VLLECRCVTVRCALWCASCDCAFGGDAAVRAMLYLTGANAITFMRSR
jgi:hypothetical protein